MAATYKRRNFQFDEGASDTLEAQWMAQMASGDAATAGEALTALFLAYNELFLKRLRSFGIHPDEVEDIAQQVWVEVGRAASRYPSDIPVRVFLFRYVEYGRRRYWSGRKSAPQMDSLSDEIVEAVAESVAQASSTPRPGSLEYLDFIRCVRGAFAAFEQAHPRLASLLMFRHVEERSLDEIAVDLGDRPNAIKSELFSARRKFEPKVRPCLGLWPDWEART